MSKKEAQARIKINKLLELAGWRFFPDSKCPDINLKPGIELTHGITAAQTTATRLLDATLHQILAA